jgi:S1-C subfamily serine protease
MIDILLILIMLGYAVSGYRQGLVVGVLSLGGFLGGAVLAMWLIPPLASQLTAGVQRSLFVLFAVLLLAWLGQFFGSMIGVRLRREFFDHPVADVDHALGAVAGVVAVAMVMWFVGGALRASPAPALSRAVASSRVLAAIDRVVPDRVVGMANTFRGVVAGSTFPRVFAGVGREDIIPVTPPDGGVMSRAAIENAEQSIVKIVGEANCNRGQEGSGVVVSPERVVTNAHVVAGVRRPRVQVGGEGRRYQAYVVAFDPDRDVAVLAVPDLDAPAIGLGHDLDRADDAVIAGFPNNGPFVASPARIRAVLRARGEDIYGQPGVIRQVYSLYGQVEPGNSGGPVLSPDGRIAGVVFAKSLDDASTGYALTLGEVMPVIREGVTSQDPVSTGTCAAG